MTFQVKRNNNNIEALLNDITKMNLKNWCHWMGKREGDREKNNEKKKI